MRRVPSLISLVLLVTSWSQAQFSYFFNNGAITIFAYTGPGGDLTIPGMIEGLPVTAIGPNAFSGSSITSISIPDTVTNIGDAAFQHCTSLTSIALPGNLLSIGTDAFQYCGLASVTIPDSVTTIGPGAFNTCTSLGEVVLPKGLTYIPDYAFIECYPLRRITLPYTITNIGDSAFASAGVTNIIFPASTISIGAHAFYGCVGLANATFSDGLTSIGAFAFTECPLSNLTFPKSLANLGAGAFAYCFGLRAAYFRGNAPGNPGNIGTPVFDQDNATAYVFPGTAGWGVNFSGIPTAPWALPYPVLFNSGLGFGPQSNQFGFVLSWATNLTVVVEASTTLSTPAWQPLQTNSLTNGSFTFTDALRTNYAARFYRARQ